MPAAQFSTGEWAMDDIWTWIVARWDDVWAWFDRPLTNGSLVLIGIIFSLIHQPSASTRLASIERQIEAIAKMIHDHIRRPAS